MVTKIEAYEQTAKLERKYVFKIILSEHDLLNADFSFEELEGMEKAKSGNLTITETAELLVGIVKKLEEGRK